MGKDSKFTQWIKWWWLKMAWVAAMVVVVALLVWRCNRAPAVPRVSESLADSLQLIDQGRMQRVDYKGFRVYYNSSWHLPACVAYELTQAESQGTLPRSNKWMSDDTVAGCAASDDLKGSGYDRGHMAPAGDMKWDADAMQQSFMMTNVCPQDHALNEGDWNKLEEKVREWVQRDSALIVITGPILTAADKRMLGLTRVRVPGAFYKIVLAHRAHPMRVAAFIYPNEACDDRLLDHAVTVRDIERRTGIDFFKALPQDEQDRLETTVNLNYWLN